MIKELDDYLDVIYKKYPYVDKADIKRVLVHGFDKWYRLSNRRAIVQFENGKFTARCKYNFRDRSINAGYILRKTAAKARLNYKYFHKIFDGVYYFALTDEEFEALNYDPDARKPITFKNIRIHKIKEECFVLKKYKHFFKIHYPVDVGWELVLKRFKTSIYKKYAERDHRGSIIFL